MFIIDFDDTLFDTHRFKAARAEALYALGVTPEHCLESYQRSYSSAEGRASYSDENHADQLELLGYDRAAAREALMAISRNLPDFLLPGAVNFLTELSQFGRPLILLSLGDAAFQEFKVKGVGIHDYFDRIFFVDDTKQSVVGELARAFHEEAPWLINDKVGESLTLLEHYPELRVVLRQSPSIPIEQYETSGLPTFQDLSSILAYVKHELAR